MHTGRATVIVNFSDEIISSVIGNGGDISGGLSAMFFFILPSYQKDVMTRGVPAARKFRKLVMFDVFFHLYYPLLNVLNINPIFPSR